jgi:DNA helicase-2/ATP-dependent DNA helicase PcrA
LEEERRLLFVGITRAQEELQLSMARYREFRGQRRLTVPSQFLMELPVAEFERNEAAVNVWETFPGDEAEHDDAHEHHEEEGDVSFDVAEFETPPKNVVAGASTSPTIAIQTAADLAGEKKVERPAVSPEVFAQGMAVMHPEYGLGKIIALSGAGLRRVATVAFATNGQKKFILANSALRPVRG